MELLLVTAGPWQVGLNARHVRAVSTHGQAADLRLLSLNDLLAGPPSPLPGERARAVQVASTPAMWLTIDTILGFEDLDPALLAPLSPFLWQHGTPRWVLGTLWLKSRLLYLVDLLAAADGQGGRP